MTAFIFAIIIVAAIGVIAGLILAIAPFMAEAMTLSETARWYMRFMFLLCLICSRTGI